MDQTFSGNLVDGDQYLHCYNDNAWSASNNLTRKDRVTNYGAANIYQCDNIVLDNITITNHTAGNGFGLAVYTSRNVTVRNSNFSNNNRGIRLGTGTDAGGAHNATVEHSAFNRNSLTGIEADDTDSVTLYNNTLTYHIDSGDEGLFIYQSNYWNVSENDFSHNYAGIRDDNYNDYNNFTGNNFVNNTYAGIYLIYSDNSIYRENVFLDNARGVKIYSSGANYNLFYHSNFYSSSTVHAESPDTDNQFNTTGMGNYWDDFDTPGEGCEDGNSDGFCDAQYNTSGSGVDYFPYTSEVIFERNPPTIHNLTAPANGSIVSTTNSTQFKFNASDDTALRNCTLYADFTGSWQANTTISSITNNIETTIAILNISAGTYVWNILCYDTSIKNNRAWFGNNYSLTTVVSNTAPNTTQVIANASSIHNYTTDDISCYANLTDSDSGDTLYANYSWYKNDVLNVTGQQTTIENGNISFISSLMAANSSINDNWTCSVQAYDGTVYESDWNNNTITILPVICGILNKPPTVDSLLLNATEWTNRTHHNLTAHVTTSDIDGDSVKVIYNWYHNHTPLMVLNMPFENNMANVSNSTRDYSGYENNGTVYNATWNATGGYDGWGAYEFDGVNDYIQVSSDSEGFEGINEITVMAWVKHTNFVGSQFYVASETGGSFSWVLADYLWAIRNSDHTYCYNWATIGLDFIWHHITGVYNGSHLLIYKDGTLIDSDTTCSGKIDTNNFPLTIGGYHYPYFFNGTIDEVQVYNRSLSASQIWALYNNYTNLTASGDTQKWDVWNVSATPNDGSHDGAVVMSNNLTILNSDPEPPTPSLPANGSTTNRTPSFTWDNVNDNDSETITYNLVIDDNVAFNNPEVNQSGISEGSESNTTYEITTELDVDTTYYWKILAMDSTSHSEDSPVRQLTVDSLLSISIITNSVDFGIFGQGGSDDTTDNSPPPFKAENSGNILGNVTITATAMFSDNPSSTYQFKVAEDESSAFDTGNSQTDWADVPTSSSAKDVYDLDWRDVNDNFLAHLKVAPLEDELAGEKTSTVTFSIE